MLLLCTWSQNRGWSDCRIQTNLWKKGLVFVCLRGDEWPVSTGWLVCTIKLSKRKDFSPNSAFSRRIMEFRVVCDYGGGTRRASQGRGRRSGRVLSAASSVAPQSVRGDMGDKCRLISYRMGRLISTLYQKTDTHALTLWSNKLKWVYPSVRPLGFTKCRENSCVIAQRGRQPSNLHHLLGRLKANRKRQRAKWSTDDLLSVTQITPDMFDFISWAFTKPAKGA